MSKTGESTFSTSALRSMALGSGTKSHVTVNQRKLIDKILARYSSNFVVFRELTQNADDAKATSFYLEIISDESKLNHHRYATSSEVQQASNRERSTIESFFRLPWRKSKDQTASTSIQLSGTSIDDPHLSDIDFHNSKIIEMRVSNNGHPFTKTDWQRVAAIADGNINVDSVGQFGVGFFSVFAYSDQPIIVSGKEYMAFVWDDDQTLTTYCHDLPIEEQSQLTSVILQLRSPLVIERSSDQDSRCGTESSKIKQSSSNKKTVPLDKTIPKIDLEQLKIFFAKVLSFTQNINEVIIFINGIKFFQVNKTKSIVPILKRSTQLKQSSMNNILQMGSLIHSEQTFSISNGSSLTLGHVTVEAKVTIDEDLHQMIERTIKKRLPSNILIQILYAQDKLINTLQSLYMTGHNTQMDTSTRILHSLIPLKFDHGSITPAGLIFIGFATHQTTGIGMHVHSHLIPTMERECLDLQDPYIALWNKELLTATGQIVRFIYEQIIPNTIKNLTKPSDIAPIFTSYAFDTTSPNQQIGMAIFEGFFSSNKDLLVPIRQSPTDCQLSLISSKTAFLAYSKYMHEFLTLPLVPYEIFQSGLFFALKQNGLIGEVDKTIISKFLSNTVLHSNELVTLLTWLRTEEYQDKSYIKYILSNAHFREDTNKSTIDFQNIKYYDTFNVSPMLPLPPNILPNKIARQFSPEDLQSTFFLTGCTLKDLLEFYLSTNQIKLLQEAQTSECLLRFISTNSWQIVDTYWIKIKIALSNVKCIATNKGMKLPSESYLPSLLTTKNLAIVTFKLSSTNVDPNSENIIEDDYISFSFLKRIGCRIFDLPSLVKPSVTSFTPTVSSNDNLQALIFQIMEERANMSEADFKSIKESKFLIGTTLDSKEVLNGRYTPYELHFPSVAIELNWLSLPIVNWLDINPQSSEYAFLKEIGVREMPDISKLIDRIIEKHDSQQQKTKMNYKLSVELRFFAKHFQQHYCGKETIDKFQRSFLPSVWPEPIIDAANGTIETEVVLLPPNKTYIDISPLCPVLLPEVVLLFHEHLHVGLLGVKEKPSLTEAFDFLMEKRIELLKTIRSASVIFTYFNELDGQNRTIIERLYKTSFIPLHDNGLLVKPTEVFIRSDCHNTKRMSPPSTKTELKKQDDDEIDTTGLIDFVDFGPKANSFLSRVGVLQYPTASILAKILIERQAAYFRESTSETKILEKKLKVYLYCLKRIAIINNTSNELLTRPIMERLQREPWCIGYQILIRADGTEEKIFKIATPKEIYLDDDHLSAIDLKPLCSPEEPIFTDLYQQFGSKWLSDCVQRVFVHVGSTQSSDRARNLCELILYRFDMLFVNNRGIRLAAIDERKAELISNTLSVCETDRIECLLTFEGKTTVFKSNCSNSCSLEFENDRITMYLLRDHVDIDYFEIARAIAQFVFKNPDEAIFYAINDKLASPVEVLKRRGIPVDRLLKHIDIQKRK